MSQFSKVNCNFGAPMGRRNSGTMPTSSKSVNLFKVELDSGGYDDGGAYWGTGGNPLYCARSSECDYQEFARAETRLDAAIAMRLPNKVLTASPKMQAIRFLEKNVVTAAALTKRKSLIELGYGES